jgi:hypothetical protein
MNGSDAYGDALAQAIGQWKDVVHFTPHAVEAAHISAWGIILRLNDGTLEVTNPGNTDLATVRFEATWGAGGGAIAHEISYYDAPKTESYSDTKLISSGGVNPFDPNGINLYATLAVEADGDNLSLHGGILTSALSAANFGHTASFPGLVALDANGNILPDASQWVTVTTASGVEIPILSAIPTAVPEPSSLVMVVGTGGIACLWFQWRRRPRR